MSDKNENDQGSNQNQDNNGSSSNQENNPPLRDTNTYLEKGEKGGTEKR